MTGQSYSLPNFDTITTITTAMINVLLSFILTCSHIFVEKYRPNFPSLSLWLTVTKRYVFHCPRNSVYQYYFKRLRNSVFSFRRSSADIVRSLKMQKLKPRVKVWNISTARIIPKLILSQNVFHFRCDQTLWQSLACQRWGYPNAN